MSKQYRSVKKRRILRVFFLVSFVLTLFLSHVFIATNSFAFGTVKAQNQNVSQVVAKGIEYYNQGKFREAVQEWELALKKYKELPEQAVVRGNLASRGISNQNAIISRKRAPPPYHLVRTKSQGELTKRVGMHLVKLMKLTQKTLPTYISWHLRSLPKRYLI